MDLNAKYEKRYYDSLTTIDPNKDISYYDWSK
jgi:hypothetical protein